MRMSMGAALKLHKRPSRSGKSLPRGDRSARVVAVAAQKGGVGKTTTTTTLAAACARFAGLRVLVIDLDPQGHVNLALRDQVLAGGGALSEVLADPRRLEVEEVATDTSIDGLFVTPPDPGLLHAEDRLAGRIGKELVLKRALEVTRTHYDLILVDCPPNLGTLTINALVSADGVLIPANPSALAMSGVSGLVDAVDEVATELNPDLEVLGVLLTRVDGRNTSTNDALIGLMEDAWGPLLVPVQVGINNALSRAQLEGRDIYDLEPASRGAQQYREVADWLVARVGLR